MNPSLRKDGSRRTGAISGSARLRVAVAAQPALFRELLTRELGRERDLAVVGSEATEEGIAKILSQEDPRILLLDYEGLGPNCESCIHHFRAAAPMTRILVLARRSGDDTIERVLCAGASGLVGKENEFSEIVRAIRAVAAGEVWANRRATALILQRLTARVPSPATSDLTAREKEIADACARGLRNKEIARSIRISEKTVKGHLNNIFRKLGVDNRVELCLRLIGDEYEPLERPGPKF